VDHSAKRNYNMIAPMIGRQGKPEKLKSAHGIRSIGLKRHNDAQQSQRGIHNCQKAELAHAHKGLRIGGFGQREINVPLRTSSIKRSMFG